MSQLNHPSAKLVAFCPKCNTFIRPCSQDSAREHVNQSHLGDDDEDLVTERPCDLTEMDLEIQRMEHDIRRLRKQRALACRVRNQHTPIARLPVEIMSEIFMWGFVHSYAEERDTRPTTFPLILGRVCHSWRRVAWGLSGLWAFFHCRISKRKCSAQAGLLEEWLCRSAQQLLSIYITMEDEDAWTNSANNSTEVIDVLISHCSRWRRLSLVIPEHWYERLSQVQGKLPNLITLSMRPPGYIFVLKPLDAFSEAPNLQSLHSSHYYLHDLQFPWTQLTTAILGTASADEALELIRRCPNLTTCRFEDLNVIESHFPVDVVMHSQIRSLEVSLDPSTVFNDFFVYLVLSNLCSLSLTLPETHGTPIPAIEAFMERSACPLKVVDIKGPFISEQDIIIFLTYNHYVTDVRVKSASDFSTSAATS